MGKKPEQDTSRKPLSYQERCQALGIERPASLTEHFPDERLTVMSQKEFKNYGNRIGPRETPYQLEDLSSMNPAVGDDRKHRMKRWWASLTPEQRAAEIAKRSEASKRK